MLSWVLGIWGLVLVATAGTLVGRRGDGTPETSAAAFAVRATAAIVVFFTLSASKRPGYILPAMVPLAILVAAGIVAAPARATAAIRRGGLLVGALGVLVLAAGLAGVSRKAEGVTVVTPGMLLWAGAFLAIWAVFASAFASRRLWATVVACALFVPGLGAAIYGPLTAYAESRSARAIADHIPSGAPVVCFRAFRTGLPFYLRRPALLLSDDARELTSNYIAANRDRLGAHSEALSAEANLGAVLNQPAPVYVLTSEAGVAQLRAASRRKLTRVYVHGRVRLLRTDG
jgi:4-amino-4-deoxy-L-arabinose transferase-like glycosyltransferase